MTSNDPLSGRRGRRGEAVSSRSARRRALDLAALLEEVAEDEDWDDEPVIRHRTSRSRRDDRYDDDRSVDMLLDRLERAGYRASQDQSQGRMAAALERLEERLNHMEDEPRGRSRSRDRHEDDIAETLARFEERLGQRGPARDPQLDDRLARLETQLGALSGAWKASSERRPSRRDHEDEDDAPRGRLRAAVSQAQASARPRLNDVVSEISARQRRLEEENIAAEESARVVKGLEHKLDALIGQTEKQLSAFMRQAEEQRRAAAEAEERARLEAEATRKQGKAVDATVFAALEKILANIEQRMNDVAPSRAVDQLIQEVKGLRGRLDSLDQNAHESEALTEMRHGASAIRAALSRLPSTEAFARLARDMHVMSDKLTQLSDREAGHGGEGLHSAVRTLNEAVERLDLLGMRVDVLANREPSTEPLKNSIENHLTTLFDRLEEQRRAVLPPEVSTLVLSEQLDKRLADMAEQLDQASRSVHALSMATADRVAEQTAQQLGALDRSVREISSRLEFLAQAQVPSGGSVENLRGDIQKLCLQIAEVRRAGNDNPAMESMQRSVFDLVARVERAGRAENPGPALDVLRTSVNEIARQVSDAVRDAIADASFPGLENAIDALGHKLDRQPAAGASVADSAAFDTMQRSIDDLALRFDHMARNTPNGLSLNAIQHAIEELSIRLERAEESGNFNAAEAIERAVRGLSSRLDTSDRKLEGLSTLEKGLSALLAQMEDGQYLDEAAELAAARVVQDVLSHGPDGELARSVSDLRANIDRSERRTVDALEAVRGMLERMVDRISHEPISHPAPVFQTQPPQPRPQAPQAAPAAPAAAPQQSPTELARAAARRAMAEAKISNTTAPVVSVASLEAPAARRGAAPIAVHEEESESAPRVRFIAAARRSLSENSTATRPADNDDEHWETSGPGLWERARGAAASTVSTPRRKSMMVGLAASLVIMGSYQVAKNAFDGGHATNTASASRTASEEILAQLSDGGDGAEAAAQAQGPEVVSGITASATGALGSRLAAAGNQPAPYAPNEEIIPGVGGDPTAEAPKEQALAALPNPAATPGAESADPMVTGSISTSPLPIPEALPPGIGTPRLRTRAFAGDAAAQYEVGHRYAEGQNVSRNAPAAAAWFERAARQGLAPAQYRLGSLYEKGIGVAKDLHLAKVWYEKAAANGNAKAMHNMGVLYAEGGLGALDFKTAAEWFRKGAERGVRDSQYNLAILQVRGLGVKQNLSEAYMWLALAADEGDADAAVKRDQVATKLDAAALASARQAVRAWRSLPLNEEANEVNGPPGGWDDTPTAGAKASGQPRS